MEVTMTRLYGTSVSGPNYLVHLPRDAEKTLCGRLLSAVNWGYNTEDREELCKWCGKKKAVVMSLHKNIHSAAAKIARHAGGNHEINTINIIDGAADLCVVLREDDTFVARLKRQGITLTYQPSLSADAQKILDYLRKWVGHEGGEYASVIKKYCSISRREFDVGIQELLAHNLVHATVDEGTKKNLYTPAKW